MILFADENIPECERYFADHGELRRGPGRSLAAADLGDVDVLLVRSVTRVDRALLEGSGVRFVGSCTAGIDHIDRAYLDAAGIAFAHAPGANARSVVEYVWAALGHLVSARGLDLDHAVVGVVGLGHIGLRLYRLLRTLGLACVAFDPLLAGGPREGRLASLDALLAQADVITLHTPLSRGGPFPTWHMLDAARLAALRPDATLINTSRGAVIDNRALAQALSSRPDLTAVLDVWEREPEIAPELLGRVALATPHIAGYSYDGKVQGTRMVGSALRRWLALPPLAAAECGGGVEQRDRRSGPGEWRALLAAMPGIYDIAADDRRMRVALQQATDRVQAFERLRRDYPVRREASFYRSDSGAPHALAATLDAIEGPESAAR